MERSTLIKQRATIGYVWVTTVPIFTTTLITRVRCEMTVVVALAVSTYTGICRPIITQGAGTCRLIHNSPRDARRGVGYLDAVPQCARGSELAATVEDKLQLDGAEISTELDGATSCAIAVLLGHLVRDSCCIRTGNRTC